VDQWCKNRDKISNAIFNFLESELKREIKRMLVYQKSSI
jgi:hypothetical protein